MIIFATVVRLEPYTDNRYDMGVSFIERKEELARFISTNLDVLDR